MDVIAAAGSRAGLDPKPRSARYLWDVFKAFVCFLILPDREKRRYNFQASVRMILKFIRISDGA